MEKTGIIIYPQYLNMIAILLGKMRDVYNSEMNESYDKFKRGERSEFVNILGMKGELIVQNYLCNRKTKYKAAPFVSNPSAIPDIIIDNVRIDVKTIREDAPDLLVNKEAHHKLKGITHYWFIQPIGEDIARYWIYSISEVNSWKIKNVKYSDAYYKEIPKEDECQ